MSISGRSVVFLRLLEVSKSPFEELFVGEKVITRGCPMGFPPIEDEPDFCLKFVLNRYSKYPVSKNCFLEMSSIVV